MDKRIGFIGAGNMGEAMVGAMIGAGLFPPSRIGVSDVSDQRLKMMESTYGVHVTQDNVALFAASDIVALAVKPQQMADALAGIAAGPEYGPGKGPEARKLIISIAAGTPIARIEAILYKPLDPEQRARMPIIRVMPNTPALVREGMSGMSPNAHAGADDIEMTRKMLESMGKVIALPESALDAVTGVSGSGPAYVFYLIESMIAGGVRSGLSESDAAALTIQTVKGAVRLLEERGEPPAELRRKVTSPGGTTEAALRVMTENGVGDRIADAVVAATRRAGELSG